MRLPFALAASVVAIALVRPAAAQTNEYLLFVRAQAAALRQGDSPPKTAAEWHRQKTALRDRFGAIWGNPQTRLGPLEVQRFGEIARDGYRIEKLTIQTFPGVWMTANAYVPEKPATPKVPAILMVHGHWRGAKQDPVVQARCVGAVRKGFFVLVVDAFGAGERGIGKALGEYHGDMTAATLLPTGLTLSGLQVSENVRAVDYLATRPEVDSARIGITGASGGGNQTMYAAAWDERFRAAAPVCSVGNYQAYLGAACCYCEVVPGALRFTEEWAVLGMTGPRALLVINASRDARQFSVEEANISIAQARRVFETLGHAANLRHVTFDSGHDYSKPMREAVYGWMALHLKGEGNGSPMIEAPFQPEDLEMLRCFPGDSRADDFMTIPKFAAAEARRLIEAREAERAQRPEELRGRLTNLLGGFPPVSDLRLNIQTNAPGGAREITFSPEPGLGLKARHRSGGDANRLLMVLDLEGAATAEKSEFVAAGTARGWNVVTVDLRATGEHAWPNDKINRAPDHTTAQWGFWIGRPLLGQWVHDIRRLLDAYERSEGALPKQVAIAGSGPAGIVALTAAVLDSRITHVAAVQTLATFVTDVPYEEQRMGIIVPGILKHVGDVADLCALVAPKPLLFAGAISPAGLEIEETIVRDLFRNATRHFEETGAGGELRISSLVTGTVVADFLDGEGER